MKDSNPLLEVLKQEKLSNAFADKDKITHAMTTIEKTTSKTIAEKSELPKLSFVPKKSVASNITKLIMLTIFVVTIFAFEFYSIRQDMSNLEQKLKPYQNKYFEQAKQLPKTLN